MAWHGMAWHDHIMTRCGADIAWHGMAWRGMGMPGKWVYAPCPRPTSNANGCCTNKLCPSPPACLSRNLAMQCGSPRRSASENLRRPAASTCSRCSLGASRLPLAAAAGAAARGACWRRRWRSAITRRAAGVYSLSATSSLRAGMGNGVHTTVKTARAFESKSANSELALPSQAIHGRAAQRLHSARLYPAR